MTASTARRGALALLLAGLVLFLLGSIELARAATQMVTISDFAFSPATVTIAAGDTVTWTNTDPVVHTATSTPGAFDSGDIAQGDTFSFTFTTPGTYDYFCTPHPTMTGQIVVQAAAPAVTAAPSPAGWPLPNVAMPQEWPANTLILIGMLLVGGAGLAVIARRPRD
jgi:plastocyanin